MKAKAAILPIAAITVASIASLLHAAQPDAGLTVNITDPADNAQILWNTQAPYAITVAYDGKSTRYDELPANTVVLRTSYVADVDKPRVRSEEPLPEGLIEISRSNCMGCHDFAANSEGPSFASIARRYAGKPAAVALLAAHIRDGSRGTWGTGTMPPHQDLSREQATAIAQWVTGHAADVTVHYAIGKSGSFRMSAPGRPGPHAGMALSAFYTGPRKIGDMSAANGRNTVIVRGTGS